jgi:methionine-rich copper-binding protein CopC/putative copper export protein
VELTLFTNLLGAIGLGAASGLNAWIPLLGLGIAERLGLVTLTEPFDRLGSTGVLVALGVVFLLDLVGDRVPILDTVLHGIGTVVAPVSGAVVFAAQENLLSQSHPWAAALAGMVLGESVHLARSTVRPAITAGTGGIGNPIASAIEDVTSFVLTVLAVVVPVMAFVAATVGSVFVFRRVRRRRRRSRSAAGTAGVGLVLVLVCCLGMVGTAPPAGAHAVLVASDPGADALLEAPPTQVVLTFNEGVEIAADAIRLLDPSGEEVPDVDSQADGVTVRAELPELDQDGSYTVNWAAVSSDGHPVRGAFLFHLRERTLDEPVESVTGGTPLSATLVRALGATTAIAGLVWVLASAFTGRRPRARWAPVLVGTLLGLLGAVLAVGDSWGDALGVVVDTTSGRMGLVALGVAVVGFAVSWIPRAGQVELAVASAAVVALAAQGHAVSIPPLARSAGLTVLHVVAAVAWATALVWLERRSRDGDPSALRRAVLRLSPWGIGAVVVLAVSGSLLVVDRVGIDELTTSAYGRISLLKVVLLVVAVGLAIRHRWSLTPALTEGVDPGDKAPAVARLRSSVRVEVVVLALALVAGSVLAQVAPPDAAGAATGGAFVQRMAFGDGQVELTVEPGRRGTNEMHITALGPDGRLMEGIDDLAVALTLRSDDVGPLEPQMQRITTGHSLTYAEIPLPGEWTVEVTARPSQFEELRAGFTVPVGE